ncbi:MAG: hypothetical protein U0T32_01430 [Chitinophagales bacterium]
MKNEFPEYMYPTEQELEMKVNAQVMFVKNDISKRSCSTTEKSDK